MDEEIREAISNMRVYLEDIEEQIKEFSPFLVVPEGYRRAVPKIQEIRDMLTGIEDESETILSRIEAILGPDES